MAPCLNTTLSNLEQRVELLPGVVALGGGALRACQQGWVRSEVITIVGGFFIADPFGLRLSALIMFGWVVELAIAAGMQVGAALGTDVERAHTASGRIRNLLAALPAVEIHSDQ